MGDDSAAEFISSLNNLPHLKELNLAVNAVAMRGCQSLAVLLRNSESKLKTLQLGSNNIGDHSDNIVSMVHDNLEGFPNYLMHVTNTFGPYLTNADRMDRANTFFDFYDSTFGGCDMLNHQWGPEIAVYFLCGFDDYHSFATAIDNIDPAQSEMMQTTRLDVVEHSDDILILIE